MAILDGGWFLKKIATLLIIFKRSAKLIHLCYNKDVIDAVAVRKYVIRDLQLDFNTLMHTTLYDMYNMHESNVVSGPEMLFNIICKWYIDRDKNTRYCFDCLYEFMVKCNERKQLTIDMANYLET